MHKDRLKSDIQKVAHRILRNQSNGYSIDKLQEDFNRLKNQAEKRGIDINFMEGKKDGK